MEITNNLEGTPKVVKLKELKLTFAVTGCNKDIRRVEIKDGKATRIEGGNK